MRVVQRSLSVGFRYRDGAASPGIGEFEPHRYGAQPLADLREPGVALQSGLAIGRHLGAGFRLVASDDRTTLEHLEITARGAGMRAHLGRAPLGYGDGFGGGVVLSGHVPVDALQVATDGPFRLPWVLGMLGPVTLHGFMGRMTEARHPGDPFIWGASGQVMPHPRLRLAVHRAALFGGDEATKQVTFDRVLKMLVGRVASVGFEDQVVSVSGRFHLPTEGALPLTAYLEWGAEDAAGAWFDVPGIVVGLWSPRLPSAAGIAAGIEYARFGESCCGNPEWYRHWSFVGSWASRDMTLGHPVGGDGSQWSAHVSGDFARNRVRTRVKAFSRDRGVENLFSPERKGRSIGADHRTDMRIGRSWELGVRSAAEWGDGWREAHMELGISHF